MAKHGTTYRIGTGATSLLMVLVILCLTALSVVSYTAADAEKRLSVRSGAVTSAVMETQGLANRKLAQIDAAIAKARTQADSDDTYEKLLIQLLSQIEDIAVEGRVVSYAMPATDHLTLHVALTVNDWTAATRYTITSWATQATADEGSMLMFD